MANSRVFQANSDGWCYHCELPIQRNDQVQYNEDDDLVHANCVGAFGDDGKAKVCDVCHIQLPRSGICGYC
jgi:hypothetical protein